MTIPNYIAHPNPKDTPPPDILSHAPQLHLTRRIHDPRQTGFSRTPPPLPGTESTNLNPK